MTHSEPISIVVGPTASGKSSYALEIAAAKDGVIINADSMQIYDALHVLSAQPHPEDLELAPHRLYSALQASERCTPQLWRDMVIPEIHSAQNAGKHPILVGGTGLYIRALIEGFSPTPEIPAEARDDAILWQQKLGNPVYHKALSKFDPEMAAQLNPNDTQRLIRAWEVFKSTGKSLAYWQTFPPSGPPEGMTFDIHFINPPREELYERCNMRFDYMLDSGILDEIKALRTQIKDGIAPDDAPITNALGFRVLSDYLDGEISLEDAVDKAKTDTRRYAKRQVTWFRNQLPETITEII